jgi:ABC-2 type transport system ATP-binding protein
MNPSAEGKATKIVAAGLSKFYGARRGIEALNLQIHRGEIFGLLGPNGAGKTTTLRLLTGFLRPSGGRATIDGLDCWRQRHRILAGVGYVPGHVRLYEHMRARRLIRLVDALHGGGHLPWAMNLAQRLRFDPSLRIRKYSRGNKQKLAVVLAMMHRPALIVLDEPTISLDPIITNEVHRLLVEARAAGATVLFSSHVLAEVEKVCDRVGVLRDGRLVAVQRTEQFRQNHVQRVRVTFRGVPPPAPPPLRVLRQVDKRTVEYSITGEVNAAVRWLANQDVGHLEITWPRLEDVFLSYYQDAPAPWAAGGPAKQERP